MMSYEIEESSDYWKQNKEESIFYINLYTMLRWVENKQCTTQTQNTDFLWPVYFLYQEDSVLKRGNMGQGKSACWHIWKASCKTFITFFESLQKALWYFGGFSMHKASWYFGGFPKVLTLWKTIPKYHEAFYSYSKNVINVLQEAFQILFEILF